jgi:hypothetical protein
VSEFLPDHQQVQKQSTTTSIEPVQAADRYQIFEQTALEHLRTGSNQSKPVIFLPMPVRLAAITAIMVTGLGVLWAIFARVPIQVNGIAAIVPEGIISSAKASTDGVLNWQVSGVGPDLLSEQLRNRNLALSRFWDTAVVKDTTTLPIQQLKKLVLLSINLPVQGQRLVLPETMNSFDNEGGSFGNNDKLFFAPSSIVAQIDSPVAVQQLDAKLRVLQPKLAIEQLSSRESRIRYKEYKALDSPIAIGGRDVRKALAERQTMLERLQALQTKGYISEEAILQEKLKVSKLRQELVAIDRDRLGNNFSGTDQSQQASRADLNALQATNELQDALTSYLWEAFIISPPGGIYLVAKYMRNGMYVRNGDELFTFSNRPPTLPSRIPVFVDAVAFQQLSEGMRVLVTPKGISRSQYGGIIGVVDDIGLLPLSGDAMAAVAGGRTLASSISKVIASPYAVKVKLQIADQKYCNQILSRRCYRWSTRRIPPFPVRIGTEADVQITTTYRRPIDFVMPFLRQALGLVVENR